MAFDLYHSKAEIYARDQMVQVSGALDALSPTMLLTQLERMSFKLGGHSASKRDATDM